MRKLDRVQEALGSRRCLILSDGIRNTWTDMDRQSSQNEWKKKQEKPTNPNADHVKQTDVGARRIKRRCGVWSVKCGMWSVECKVWSGDWRVWSVKCGV